MGYSVDQGVFPNADGILLSSHHWTISGILLARSVIVFEAVVLKVVMNVSEEYAASIIRVGVKIETQGSCKTLITTNETTVSYFRRTQREIFTAAKTPNVAVQ
jgi:hypothetical protein